MYCPYIYTQQPQPRVSSGSNGSSAVCAVLLPLFFLFFVLFIMILFNKFEIEEEFTFAEPSSRIPKIDLSPTSASIPPQKKEYKRIQTPREGIIKLVNGKAKIIHHNIKKDSVIMLSRKNIDQKAGTHLVIDDIVVDECFNVISTDDQGIIEENDCGEIYFVIL